LGSVLFKELKVGDKVRISVEKTDRGLFAATLDLAAHKAKRLSERTPEANL